MSNLKLSTDDPKVRFCSVLGSKYFLFHKFVFVVVFWNCWVPIRRYVVIFPRCDIFLHEFSSCKIVKILRQFDSFRKAGRGQKYKPPERRDVSASINWWDWPQCQMVYQSRLVYVYRVLLVSTFTQMVKDDGCIQCHPCEISLSAFHSNFGIEWLLCF